MSAAVVITLDTSPPQGRVSGETTVDHHEPFVILIRSSKTLAPSSSAVLISVSGLRVPIGVEVDETEMTVRVETFELLDRTYTLRVILYDLAGNASVMDIQLKISGQSNTIQVDHVFVGEAKSVDVTQTRPFLVEVSVSQAGEP